MSYSRRAAEAVAWLGGRATTARNDFVHGAWGQQQRTFDVAQQESLIDKAGTRREPAILLLLEHAQSGAVLSLSLPRALSPSLSSLLPHRATMPTTTRSGGSRFNVLKDLNLERSLDPLTKDPLVKSIVQEKIIISSKTLS